jgi:NlpC/P60 family putative phage cell wall peptidase
MPNHTQKIVTIAKSWLGTPYRHQASCKGAGADCLGLIRGVWRELYGQETEVPPPYSKDWAETGGAEILLEAARRYLIEKETKHPDPGDVLLFRWKPNYPAKHAGIMVLDTEFIHAYEGNGVVQSGLEVWKPKLSFVFGFPEF